MQPSIVFAVLSKLPQIHSLCGEHLNTVVKTIYYIHIPSAIKCKI